MSLIHVLVVEELDSRELGTCRTFQQHEEARFLQMSRATKTNRNLKVLFQGQRQFFIAPL